MRKDNEMGGNIPGGNFLSGKFPRGNFPGVSLMGGNFPGGNFPRTLTYKLFFQKHSPPKVLCEKRIQKYFAKFTGIVCVGVAFLIKLTI